MNVLQRFLHRRVCAFLGTCDMDWIYQGMTGHRRCLHCHKTIRGER